VGGADSERKTEINHTLTRGLLLRRVLRCRVRVWEFESEECEPELDPVGGTRVLLVNAKVGVSRMSVIDVGCSVFTNGKANEGGWVHARCDFGSWVGPAKCHWNVASKARQHWCHAKGHRSLQDLKLELVGLEPRCRTEWTPPPRLVAHALPREKRWAGEVGRKVGFRQSELVES
jgi:hypothetical protein